MTAYYLSEKERKEAYNNRFYSWNVWFERHLGKIVGKGFGVRNWFGASEEGEWTYVNIKTDQTQFFFAIFIVTIFMFILVQSLLTIPQNWINFSVATIYLFMTAFMGMIVIGNYISKKAPHEYMSYGILSWDTIKLPILSTLFWIILFIVLGQFCGLNLQQTIASMQQQIIVTTLLLGVVQVFLIPWVETAFFVVVVLPTVARFTGIFFAIIFTALFSGGIHFWVLHGNIFSVIMSILFGLILYPYALKYLASYPVLIAHIEANTLAIILNGLIK